MTSKIHQTKAGCVNLFNIKTAKNPKVFDMRFYQHEIEKAIKHHFTYIDTPFSELLTLESV